VIVATETVDLREAAMVALRQPTLCAAFQVTAAANAARPALRTPDDSVSLTWAQYAARVKSIATGLAALGVGDGDTVALLLANRPEFHLLDTASIHLGAVPFSVYHTNPAEQIAYQLTNSEARVFVTEAAFLERVRAACEIAGTVEHLVVVDDAEPTGHMTLAELEAAGDAAFDFDAAWRAVSPEHLANLVYTSGTTGDPKGVQHHHGGLVFGLGVMDRLAPISPEGRVVSYLPMAHIAERYISHYSSLAFGYTITCCPDPKQLPQAIATTKPTRFFGVPRIYEKLRGAALGIIEADPLLTAALEAGLARVRVEQSGEQPEPLDAEHEDALAGLRQRLGLDEAEWVGVAAAPTPYAVLEFFHAIGVRIAELWGMSETVLTTSNPPDRIKLGSIGVAIPGIEVRLADDGEILVRGPNVTSGYRNDPERTGEALDADGWMHSGDIAVADEDGYMRIVDRKKEIIINSAGKNMSPAHIECTIKEECPLIGQVVAIGDARPYVTALVVLDAEAAARLAQDGLPPDIGELVEHERVRAEIDAAVERGNQRLARVEQIKKYALLPMTWEPGGDEVTPTMKLKRRPIAEKYVAEIRALYGS
jgi:long-chain acyl-CoA synthetase